MGVPLPLIITALQLVAILLISLILGTVFGIWRGYNPAGYSASTFIEMHQGAVRGLNVILPIMGLVTLLLAAALAVASRSRPGVLVLYGAAFVAIAIAGAVTRFGNQPINEQIMAWTITTLPVDWAMVRDKWLDLNLIRVASSFVGEALLVAAIFADRNA